MRITHVALWTRDIDRLREFYERWFQAVPGPRYVNARRQFSSYFLTIGDGASLELMQRPDISEGPQEQALGYAHVALSVGNEGEVDRLTRELAQAGVPVVDGPRRTGDGYYESVVLDPDGNRIELTT
jgi:lactoylglutathione lyase